jgi:RNA polymerase primary sigma factor
MSRPTAKLSHEQTQARLREYALWVREHGAESPRAIEVRNRIVEGNLGLVFSVSQRSARHRIPHDDVLGVGVPGLIKAIERFDVERGVRFSTYACWWVRHALLRTADNELDLVRAPTHARSRTQPPKSAAIREAAAAAMRPACSLDSPMGDEDTRTTFVDAMADDQALAAFDHIDEADQHEALKRALAALPDDERTILEAHTAGNLLEVGLRLGWSRERVREALARGLGRLRRLLRAA